MRTVTSRTWMTLAAAATLYFTLNTLHKQGYLASKRSEDEEVSTSTTSDATDLPCEAAATDAEASPGAQQQPAESGLLKRLSRHWVSVAAVTAVFVVAAAAVWVAATS
jgi:hypothetical protein